MTRRKVLLVALSIGVAIGLATWVYVGPVTAHPGNTCNPPAGHGRPGCHKSATTTTAKPTTTTAKPTTTTTKASTTTTRKPTTTTTKKLTTTTTASNTTASTATTTLLATTTTASTTTTLMPGTVVSLAPVDPTAFFGSTDDRKTVDAARAIVAGLALLGTGGPPDTSGPGPTGGSPSDKAAGMNGAATGDAAAGDAGAAEDLVAATAGDIGAAKGPSYYFVSPVAIILLLVYAASFTLYKTKSIRVATHRKIWSLMLLGTFGITGALGVAMAIGISQNPPLVLPQWLLFWHVETGVAMCFISLFHIGWLAITSWRSSPAERAQAATR